MTKHPYIGRRVRFYLAPYGVNVSGTVVKAEGRMLTVNNVLPRVPGMDTIRFNETCVQHVMED